MNSKLSSGGSRWQRWLAALLAVTLAVPVGAAAAIVATPAQAASAAPSVPVSPEAAASAQATATGKPLVVDADRTAYTDTVANPDGSFTWTANQEPQHGWNGAAWVAPDATLHTNPDGSLSPNAPASGLVLSGGGTGPLASLDDRAGHRLSITMPMRLPKPRVTGATATYGLVLPGVDLQITATVRGGIDEVLVVHDAAAAANPALAHLTLSTAVSGLKLTTDPASGAISANDATTGRPVFAAPPPLMWDSATSTHSPAQQAQADPLDERPATSSAAGPGAAAHSTTIPVSGAGGAITLSPPTAALTGKGVTYPVYIDPAISPTTNPRAYTQSWHPNTTAYNPSDNLRTGFDDWPADYQNGITRSFLRFDGLSAVAGKYIQEAHLQLTELNTSNTSTTTYYRVVVSNTDPWGSNLTWNNQPGFGGYNPWADIPGNARDTSSQWQINVTDMIWWVAGTSLPSINMVMHMGDEANDLKYKHWGLNPALVVTYWSTPNTPTNLAVKNGNSSYGCSTSAPGTWIPAASGNQISLNDAVSTPDADTDLTAHTYLSTNGGASTDYPTTVHQTGATPVNVTTTISVADGSSYSWYATAANKFRTSPASSTCYFRYDGRTPSAPTVTSTAYPVNGPTTVTSGGSGNLTLSASDPGTNPSGVASFNYNINGTSISSGGSGQRSISAASGSAVLSVPLSSLHWGTNTVWVQTVDRAGNLSQPLAYSFYVQQSAFGTYTPGTAGDIDGDANPDLVTVDSAGNLRLFTHPDTVSVNPTGNTTADPLQYGGRVLIPYNQDILWPGGTFAGALVTHAGSFSGNNTDDLLIAQNGNLGVAQNVNANGTAWTMTSVDKPTCGSCPNYNGLDWSSVIQMFAVPTTAGGRPKLLTIEYVNNSATMWLYTPVATGPPAFNPPTLISAYISSWQWEAVQIVGAGPLPGSTGTTVWVRLLGSVGQMYVLHNIEAGIPDPSSAAITVADDGYGIGQWPLMTTVGRADANGNLPLWATDAAGHLVVIPTTTTTGGTTTIGNAQTLSAGGWASHEQALQSNYRPYNNMGIAWDGEIEEASFDNFGYSYSYRALANATLSNGAVSACPPSYTATCPAGLIGAGTLTVPLSNGSYTFTLPAPWAHRWDNYQAAGQVIPAPLNPNFAPSRYISFLGAASTGTSGGISGTATITYTNGHTQQITLTFSDWTLNGDAWTPAPGNITVATGAYRDNITTGTQDTTRHTYLYATAEIQLLDNGAPLPDGVQIASITLPNNSHIHVFSTAVT